MNNLEKYLRSLKDKKLLTGKAIGGDWQIYINTEDGYDEKVFTLKEVNELIGKVDENDNS